MSFDYKYVINPTGPAENHIIREMFDDIKDYINDTDNFDFANKALSNLASVAINTSLVSDTDNTDDLGSSTKAWKDVYAASIKRGSSTGIAISAAGEITQPLQPSFLVVDGTGAADVTGDGTTYTEQWPTEIYDQGGDFASNTFTAPVTGKYLLSAQVLLLNILVGASTRSITIVTSNRNYQDTSSYALAELFKDFRTTVLADMDANDTALVQVRVASQTKTVDINAGATTNYFSGSLIN